MKKKLNKENILIFTVNHYRLKCLSSCQFLNIRKLIDCLNCDVMQSNVMIRLNMFLMIF